MYVCKCVSVNVCVCVCVCVSVSVCVFFKHMCMGACVRVMHVLYIYYARVYASAYLHASCMHVCVRPPMHA